MFCNWRTDTATVPYSSTVRQQDKSPYRLLTFKNVFYKVKIIQILFTMNCLDLIRETFLNIRCTETFHPHRFKMEILS